MDHDSLEADLKNLVAVAMDLLELEKSARLVSELYRVVQTLEMLPGCFVLVDQEELVGDFAELVAVQVVVVAAEEVEIPFAARYYSFAEVQTLVALALLVATHAAA